MDKNKNLTIEETFNLAVQKHQKNNIKEAQELYNQVLKNNPSHAQALNNLAVILSSKG